MNFSVLLVGEGSVGKGSFIHMYKNNKFNNTGPINTYLNCNTNHGMIRLNLTQSRNYEKGYDANLIMFDCSNSDTLGILNQIPNNNIPKIFIGNKFDVKCDLKIFPIIKREIITSQKYPYFNISVMHNYGISEVISYLLKQLVSNDIRLI